MKSKGPERVSGLDESRSALPERRGKHRREQCNPDRNQATVQVTDEKHDDQHRCGDDHRLHGWSEEGAVRSTSRGLCGETSPWPAFSTGG